MYKVAKKLGKVEEHTSLTLKSVTVLNKHLDPFIINHFRVAKISDLELFGTEKTVWD